MKSELKEIESEVIKLKSPPHGAAHTYKTQLKVLWVKTPHLNQRLLKGFSFSSLEHAQQKKIWDEAFKTSGYLEVKTMALLYFRHRRYKQTLTLNDFETLKSWSHFIENWLHSDMLSELYSELREKYSHHVLSVLETWNSHKNPWKRRLSLTSLLYYSRQRKKVPSFKDIRRLIEGRLSDNEYYVQKAVGWTLRETHQIYPKETKKFIHQRFQDISSHAFSAAVEKWPTNEKEILKSKRKQARTKSF